MNHDSVPLPFRGKSVWRWLGRGLMRSRLPALLTTTISAPTKIQGTSYMSAMLVHLSSTTMSTDIAISCPTKQVGKT